MAQTPLGITYPEAGSHTRLWEHFQTLADDVDALVGGLRDPDRVEIQRDSLTLSSGDNTPISGGFAGLGGHRPGTAFSYGGGVVGILRPMIALHVVYASWSSANTGVRRLDYDCGGEIIRDSMHPTGGGGNDGQNLSVVKVHTGTTDTASMTVLQTSGSNLDLFRVRWTVTPLVLL